METVKPIYYHNKHIELLRDLYGQLKYTAEYGKQIGICIISLTITNNENGNMNDKKYFEIFDTLARSFNSEKNDVLKSQFSVKIFLDIFSLFLINDFERIFETENFEAIDIFTKYAFAAVKIKYGDEIESIFNEDDLDINNKFLKARKIILNRYEKLPISEKLVD
jgi:hypothetical protein